MMKSMSVPQLRPSRSRLLLHLRWATATSAFPNSSYGRGEGGRRGEGSVANLAPVVKKAGGPRSPILVSNTRSLSNLRTPSSSSRIILCINSMRSSNPVYATTTLCVVDPLPPVNCLLRVAPIFHLQARPPSQFRRFHCSKKPPTMDSLRQLRSPPA